MLVRIPQHRKVDLAAWEDLERQDAAWSRSGALRHRVARAVRDIAGFAPDYISVSWGKDSITLSHLTRLAMGPRVPMVHVRVTGGAANPYSHLVRDAYLRVWPSDYREVEIHADLDESGAIADQRSLDRQWDDAWRSVEATVGRRYASGIRAAESTGRRRRVSLGLARGRTLAPLGHWSERDVFGYIYREGLPAHPVYAMSFGGSWGRDRLRVDMCGGPEGRGFGRADWERAYLARPGKT